MSTPLASAAVTPDRATNGLARMPRWISWTLLLIAAAYFLVRGPLEALDRSGDLAYGYSAAVAWLEGLDPYDQATLITTLEARGGDISRVAEQLRYNIHPPMALPVFVVLGFFAWDVAVWAVLASNVIAGGLAWLGLTRFIGWQARATPSLLLAAAMLAMAPAHWTIAIGQSGLVVVALLVWVMVLAHGRPRLAGAMLAIATALKVTLAAPFLAYALVRTRWRVVGAAVIVLAALSIVSIIRLEAAGIGWIDGYTGNLEASVGPGGLNGADRENPFRTTLVQLQYLLLEVVDGETTAGIIGLAIVIVAAVITVLIVPGRTRESELLGYSLVAVLTLLATYHRSYDAVLLFFPIAWGIRALWVGRWVAGAVVLLLCADFLGSFQAWAVTVGSSLPDAVTASVPWRSVILTQHVWALVALTITLLVVAGLDRRRITVVDGTSTAASGPRAPEPPHDRRSP